jgi:beta-glucosidase/6-phospho-beta-glucosidase/beta-galactosidase
LAHFLFATGVENSYPTIELPDGSTKRVDEMEKCRHYQCWEEDFQLVGNLGIEFLRYGPPYYNTHLGPGKYDWHFTDLTFGRLKEIGITPIADLCHFGVPDWVGNFQNEEWPELFAEYARAFASRFPWVRFYTPVNEIFIAATFSAQYGWWNERLQTDKAFVTAIHNLCRANVLAMHAILEIQPRAIFIQSESSEYFHPEKPTCIRDAEFYNEKRFLSLDLTYGNDLDVRMYEYLMDNGMTRDQYHWFGRHHRKPHCIMGNDYYITNEHLVQKDGSIVPAGEIFGYYVITHQYFSRYGLPVMHTETNLADTERASGWLRKEWANVHRLKQDGVPLIGFTWYSLTDQVDWDTALREDNGTVNPLGLYDLDRKIRPVGETYREPIAEWREILPTQSLSHALSP